MGLTPDRSGSTVILSLIFPFVPVLVHKGKEKSLSFRYYFQPKACISVPLPSGVINLFRSLIGMEPGGNSLNAALTHVTNLRQRFRRGARGCMVNAVLLAMARRGDTPVIQELILH